MLAVANFSSLAVLVAAGDDNHMSDADTNMPGGVYCRKCGYDLRAQTAPHRCPECGRNFDPADHKTFLTRPPRGAGWRWAKRGVIGLLSVGLLLGLAWGWLYWGWANEHAALAKLKTPWFMDAPLGGDRLRESLRPAGWILDRAWAVRCEQLTTDADLVALKELSQLTQLDLGNIQVTDAGLVHLNQLKRLQTLSLHGTQVTDAGLLHLQIQVTDAGLVHLSELKRLQTLSLHGTQVTDAGLVHLQGLKGLLTLDLRGTKVTAEGVQKLRAALPGATIVWP